MNQQLDNQQLENQQPENQQPENRAIDAMLGGITGPDAVTEARLRARLSDQAERRGLLDLAYRTVDSPFGQLLLAASTEGLVRVAFEIEDHDAVLDRLAADISPRILRVPQRLDRAARQLDEYFAGARRTFEVPIDLQLVIGFRRDVLTQLRSVAYGTTASYAALAKAAGKPTAIRAAASACSHNPVPLFVPCHRIVRSDGSIGQYLGGQATKRALLDLEAAA